MNKKGLANGYAYYCTVCDIFADIKLSNDLAIEYCPSCGNGPLIDNEDELLEFLIEEKIDPATMYYAFSSDTPLEGSMCPVSPLDINMIIFRFGFLQSSGEDCGPEAVSRKTGINLKDVQEVFHFFGLHEQRSTK